MYPRWFLISLLFRLKVLSFSVRLNDGDRSGMTLQGSVPEIKRREEAPFGKVHEKRKQQVGRVIHPGSDPFHVRPHDEEQGNNVHFLFIQRFSGGEKAVSCPSRLNSRP